MNTNKTNDNNNFTRSSGIGSYNWSLRYGDGVKDKTGNYYNTKFPELILKGYSDADKAALKAYKVTFWADLLPKASEFPIKPWGAAWTIQVPEDSVLKQHWDKEQAVVRKLVPEAILAKPADFDKLYDAFLVELKKTTGAMADAEGQLVQDRIALWTK